MAPWVDGGPCANPVCKATRAAVWYGGDDGPVYCHLRPCRRLGGYLPPKGRGRDRTQADEVDNEDDYEEKCFEIKKIVGMARSNPLQKLSKKQRRNEPAGSDMWFEVFGVFADPDDDDDEGAPDRRWVQMEDLGHVAKADVKQAIAAYEEDAKKRAKAALGRYKSA